ncbi:hypothetical protein E8E12_000449 [Didymella heteroderae]|uniref:Transcription factor domain-containing protein n=1 Tax=Didymella heteroderae TaxID=1769908 RepID=A0A9P4WFG9_9PLEO|nr:hypothetical protein E8E12_000449 [Didymella heteroderae]
MRLLWTTFQRHLWPDFFFFHDKMLRELYEPQASVSPDARPEIRSEIALAFAYLALATSYLDGDGCTGGGQDGLVSRRIEFASKLFESAWELFRSDTSTSPLSLLRRTQTILMLGYIELNAGSGTGLLERAFDTLDVDFLEKTNRENMHRAAADRHFLQEARVRTAWSCFLICCKLSVEQKVHKVFSLSQLSALPLPCSDNSFLWGREVQTSPLGAVWNLGFASANEVVSSSLRGSMSDATQKVRMEDEWCGYYITIMMVLQEVMHSMGGITISTQPESEEINDKYAWLGDKLNDFVQALTQDLQLTDDNAYNHAHGYTSDL